jgi:FKBP-type peptidyl-prolyl cis-trans isomerase (trigger factor)
MTAEVATRTPTTGEHLRLLQALAGELERAMQAIVRNDLPELEDSISIQQDLSQQLSALAGELRSEAHSLNEPAGHTPMKAQIESAAAELRRLNLRYSILVEHSSRSVAMMASLFNSFRGQIQEASGARLKQQTWSCQG